MKVSVEKSGDTHKHHTILIHEYANSFRFRLRLDIMYKNSSRSGHTFKWFEI